MDARETGPLAGRRVLVTRAREQAATFVAWLELQEAEPILFPAIRIVEAEDPERLRRAALGVGDYDWLVLTSVNGVERFWAALEAMDRDTRALGVRVAAIGPATAAALRARGVQPALLPERYVAESIVDALSQTGTLEGARVLLARASGARELLPERLRELGAHVDDVEAYRTVPDAEGAAVVRRLLDVDAIDAVTFTSASTVRSFVAAVGVEVGRAAVACIGPVTAEAARELGLPVTLVAADHTIDGLGAALLWHFAGGGQT